ncbi:hypothetical protein D3C77_378490 [compost metagenome]
MNDEHAPPGQPDLVVLGHKRVRLDGDGHTFGGSGLVHTVVDDVLRQTQRQLGMPRAWIRILAARTLKLDQYIGICRVLGHLPHPGDPVADGVGATAQSIGRNEQSLARVDLIGSNRFAGGYSAPQQHRDAVTLPHSRPGRNEQLQAQKGVVVESRRKVDTPFATGHRPGFAGNLQLNQLQDT